MRLRCRMGSILLLTLTPAVALAFGKSPPGLFLEPKIKPALPAPLPQKKEDKTVTFTADEMGYDQKNAIVIARGKVEISQSGSVVLADQVTYFQRRDLVVAEGNVTLMQPSGDVIFSDRAVLNDALKTGAVEGFKARLSDESVFVARRAEKVSASVTMLEDAAYTPCNICKDAAPFWQLNADEVKIDDAAEKVIYHGANFDMFGIPVFYSPYLSHPTPDAQARSGFMTPQYASNNNLGTMIRTPFYWRIDHDKDVTLTPWFSTSQNPLLYADYRQLSDHGAYHIQASGTNPTRLDNSGNEISGNEFRGHIFAEGYENLNDDTRLGFDIKRASDDTYLRRYDLGDQPSLFSRLFIETARNRNFASLQGIAVQGLRANDESKTTPLVLPSVQSYYETSPDSNNIRYHVAGDIQLLTREEGVNQRRVSTTVGASHPYVSDTGQILTTTVNLRQDIYQTDHIVVDGMSQNNDSFRTLPQAALEWRYPLINALENGSWTVEPIMLAVLQSGAGNPAFISNEDSRLPELTDTNLFSIDRMPGLDLVDSGSRLAYGMRSQYLLNDGSTIDAMFGQNYNVADTPFPNSTKPDERFSDYIGRFAYSISPWTATYRFALDNKSFQTNRNEVSLIFAKPWLSVNTAYRSIKKSLYLQDSQEGLLDVSLPLSENWVIHGGARRDFDTDQLISANSGVVFKNECFNISLAFQRDYTRDRDVAPTTQLLFQIAFKNLGEFGGTQSGIASAAARSGL